MSSSKNHVKVVFENVFFMTFNQQQRLLRHYVALVTKFDARGPCGAKRSYPARGRNARAYLFRQWRVLQQVILPIFGYIHIFVTNCCSVWHSLQYQYGNFKHEDLIPTPL